MVDFKELKERTRIEDVVSQLGLTMKRSGDQMRGPCPHCRAGGDRSLAINTVKQSFYCFNVRKGGDLIALVGHVLDLRPKEAAERIAGTVPLQGKVPGTVPGAVPQRGTVPDSSPSPPKPAFDPVAYAASLQTSHEVLAGLELAPETLSEWMGGMATKGVHRGRLALPVTVAGRVAYFGLAVRGESPSITFPNGVDGRLAIFGADRVTKNGELRLVATPLEVLSVYQNTGETAVCFLTETVSGEQLELLAAVLGARSADLIV